VRVVIADTGPLNYLLLIDQIDLLPRIFDAVHIPDAVCAELADSRAPQIVGDWIAKPPSWLISMPTPAIGVSSSMLDAGEEAAIALAVRLKADLLLMDDRAGVRAALAREVIGALGILDQAAAAGLVDLPAVVARLTATTSV